MEGGGRRGSGGVWLGRWRLSEWMKGLGGGERGGMVLVEMVLERVTVVAGKGCWMLVGLGEVEAVEVVEDFRVGL